MPSKTQANKNYCQYLYHMGDIRERKKKKRENPALSGQESTWLFGEGDPAIRMGKHKKGW